MEHSTHCLVDPVLCAAADRRSAPSVRGRLATRSLVAGALASLCATPAAAALREYRMEFQPSPSTGVAGYTMHVGSTSGSYQAQFDLGLPPSSGATIIYALDLEDSTDLYIALRAYTPTGAVSSFSSEFHLAAIATDGGATDGGATDGGSTGGGTTDGGSTGGGTTDGGTSGGGTTDGGSTGGSTGGTGGTTMNPRGTLDPTIGLGVATGSSATIGRLMPNGSAPALTMDSFASLGGVRPDGCDLDGDGDRDLVVGFENGSNGTVAILWLENGAVVEVDSIQAGTASYRSAAGQTIPGCGDLDGDGRAELVIGFGGSMRGVVQVFDDVMTGFAPMKTDRTNAQGFMQIPVPFSKFRGRIYPALGDIDGDGRDELVAGMSGTRNGYIVVLDDAASGFAIHPVNRSGKPWLQIEPSATSSMSGGTTMPALGDLDGDGLDELAIGFGSGSRGRVAILDDAVVGYPTSRSDVLVVTTGRSTYQSKYGATQPAMGDVDDDGIDELIIGFQRSGDHEVQVFDDLSAALRPIGSTGGFVTSTDLSLSIQPAPAQ